VRQDEPLLVTAINEMAIGNPSETTLAYIKSLDKPEFGSVQQTCLFASNALAG